MPTISDRGGLNQKQAALLVGVGALRGFLAKKKENRRLEGEAPLTNYMRDEARRQGERTPNVPDIAPELLQRMDRSELAKVMALYGAQEHQQIVNDGAGLLKTRTEKWFDWYENDAQAEGFRADPMDLGTMESIRDAFGDEKFRVNSPEQLQKLEDLMDGVVENSGKLYQERMNRLRTTAAAEGWIESMYPLLNPRQQQAVEGLLGQLKAGPVEGDPRMIFSAMMKALVDLDDQGRVVSGAGQRARKVAGGGGGGGSGDAASLKGSTSGPHQKLLQQMFNDEETPEDIEAEAQRRGGTAQFDPWGNVTFHPDSLGGVHATPPPTETGDPGGDQSQQGPPPPPSEYQVWAQSTPGSGKVWDEYAAGIVNMAQRVKAGTLTEKKMAKGVAELGARLNMPAPDAQQLVDSGLSAQINAIVSGGELEPMDPSQIGPPGPGQFRADPAAPQDQGPPVPPEPAAPPGLGGIIARDAYRAGETVAKAYSSGVLNTAQAAGEFYHEQAVKLVRAAFGDVPEELAVTVKEEVVPATGSLLRFAGSVLKSQAAVQAVASYIHAASEEARFGEDGTISEEEQRIVDRLRKAVKLEGRRLTKDEEEDARKTASGFSRAWSRVKKSLKIGPSGTMGIPPTTYPMIGPAQQPSGAGVSEFEATGFLPRAQGPLRAGMDEFAATGVAPGAKPRIPRIPGPSGAGVSEFEATGVLPGAPGPRLGPQRPPAHVNDWGPFQGLVNALTELPADAPFRKKLEAKAQAQIDAAVAELGRAVAERKKEEARQIAEQKEVRIRRNREKRRRASVRRGRHRKQEE